MLAVILQEMRGGSLSDAAWEALQDRVIGVVRRGSVLQARPDGAPDPRLSQPPFSDNIVHYVLHRHTLRVCQAYCNAVRESTRQTTPLYLCIAIDEVKDKAIDHFTAPLRLAALKISNPRNTKNLPGVLALYRGMRLLLCAKSCPRLSLMHGCECILEDLIFAAEENLPLGFQVGVPYTLKFMPSHLLLRAVDAEWTLPASQLPKLPADWDKQGLFLLGPQTDYFSLWLPDSGSFEIRRTQFQVMSADSRIVYAAQGEGFEATIPDMAKPPGMDPETHWLANYVMLSRAKSLDGLLILRLCSREGLTTGAPQYLVDEIDRLCALERASTDRLKARLAKLEPHFSVTTAAVLREIFSHEEIGRASYPITMLGAETNTSGDVKVSGAMDTSSIATLLPPSKRLRAKTSSASASASQASHPVVEGSVLTPPTRDSIEKKTTPSTVLPPVLEDTRTTIANPREGLDKAAASAASRPVVKVRSSTALPTHGGTPQQTAGSASQEVVVMSADEPPVQARAAVAAAVVAAVEPAHARELPVYEDARNTELLDAISVDVDVPGWLGYVNEGDIYVDPAVAALHNPGNMCYLNALLHVFARTPGIRNWSVQHLALYGERHADHNCVLCDLGKDLRRHPPHSVRYGSFEQARSGANNLFNGNPTETCSYTYGLGGAGV